MGRTNVERHDEFSGTSVWFEIRPGSVQSDFYERILRQFEFLEDDIASSLQTVLFPLHSGPHLLLPLGSWPAGISDVL